MGSNWFVVQLKGLDASVLVLLTLLAAGVLLGGLFYIGLIGWAVGVFGRAMRLSIRVGFTIWKHLFAWADWTSFFAAIVTLLLLGELIGQASPGGWVLFGAILVFMGLTACLAYMYIDLERYEVGRGYKALHSPLKGQTLAVDLLHYGHQAGPLLLVAATVAMIGGFAMLNQGLFHTIGKAWYSLGAEKAPTFWDFLAYPLNNLLRIVDLLDLANSYQFLHATYVRPVRWPASMLLLAFRTFFTLVLLQQIFASVRQGQLLAETIAEFWSPHEPIQARARGSLPQHGVGAVQPLLESLRAVEFMTKEQREQIPLILAQIGPGAVPILERHLHDGHEQVRAIAAAALGHLRALETLPTLVQLRADPSDWVRQSLVEALGTIGASDVNAARRKRFLVRYARSSEWFVARLWRRTSAAVQAADPTELTVATLRAALADPVITVRTQAARALGLLGPVAAPALPELFGLLRDPEETVRCQVAEALSQVGKTRPETVAALVELLPDPSAVVRTCALKALGSLKQAASAVVPALLPMLQDREESVRQAAADAVGQIGVLHREHTATLIEGLASADTTVRSETAEVLGTIGEAAAAATPALVEALTDPNDRVRAKAAEALGKIGEGAAEAVPSLVRALRDKDSWVSALAAEALGEMGETADDAIPALVRSLGHMNPQVRGHAAEALGKIGSAAAVAAPALETAAHDEEGSVRRRAIEALGEIGGAAASMRNTVRAALSDPDPQVRAAAVIALGQRGEADGDVIHELLQALKDVNDQVQVETTKVLPKLAGPIAPVIEGLSRSLEDESVWVQVHAALALGQLGPSAVAAGGPLLRATQTGEATVREHALRALVMIQPPEVMIALSAGLKDANGDVRKLASAGLMKAAAIPAEVVPLLVEALQDPESQVRANAAHGLSRLQTLPAEAVAPLIECASDPRDGLRINAALALENAPITAAVRGVFSRLVEDPNARIRLIAAGFLLEQGANDDRAIAVVTEALGDSTLRLRKAALELVESLAQQGIVYLTPLKERVALEPDPELRHQIEHLVEELEKPDELESEPPPITLAS
jgi:HEAT repeat protein